MSHIDASLLARYNSLMDPHLASYFQNPKMRRQLRKNGLITRNGEIISENSYRQIMARKEHQQHVRELLAQAIVHKTLDMERMRQVQIKKKLEEISKIELVRRVKCDTERKGDEDILPYLSPHRSTSRPSSVPAGKTGWSPKQRPVSAPSRGKKSGQREMSALVTDENGVPVIRQDGPQEKGRAGRGKRKKTHMEIDDRHLYSLDSQALRDYTMTMNQSRVGPSPYRNNQMGPDMVPAPPPTRLSGRRRIQHTDRLGRPIRGKKSGPPLHRREPAKRHPEQIQTMCLVTLHYFGSHLNLDYERLDPRDEVVVEQQHCGGNTLIVFKEKVLPKSDFTFVSHRHRGYPFSLTIYIEGRVDCRLSTCCEYKHGKGSRLGGSQGHFGIVNIDGASPCYRCQVTERLKSKEEEKKHKAQKAAEKKAKDREAAGDENESHNADYSEDEDHEDTVSNAGTDSARSSVSNPQPKGYPEDEGEQTPDSGSDTDSFDSSSDDEGSPQNKKSPTEQSSDQGSRGRARKKRSSRPRSHSKSSSSSSSRSRSRSRSRSSSSSSSRSRSRERPSKDKVPASPASPDITPKRKDTGKTPLKAVKSNHGGNDTDRSSGSDTEHEIDSDRRRPPVSVGDNSNNANNSDLEITQEALPAEQKPKLGEEKMKEVEKQEEKREPAISEEHPDQPEKVSKSVAPPGHIGSENSSDDTELGTLHTGQGGDDTLKALTEEMTKVLETAQKEESPIEKSASDSSSQDSSSSDSADSSDSESERDVKPGPSQSTTDQDTSDFAGGADPDHVASDSSKPATHLSQIGVTPGPRHDGSIRPLVEGKRDIELTSLSLSEDQVAELGEVLKESPDVESLVLRNSGITNTGMKELNKGLADAKNIKMVNLNCNRLTDADQISKLLMHPKTVEILLLHGNPLGDMGIKELTASLISIHRSAATDEEMVEVRNKAKDLVADVMYDALHSSSLESIVTQGSTSSNNGSIAKLLAESERLTAGHLSGLTLKQLDLGDCKMTSEGASGVAEMIAYNLPIENLSLTANSGVDIIGWDAIAEALKVNNKITTLSLDYNNLGDGGATLIAEALEENKVIQSIDFEGNKIGEQGAQKLLDAIRKSPNIQDITLMPGNNIPESLLAQIKDELSKRGVQKYSPL